MADCGKHSPDVTAARRARLLDRCDVCVNGLGKCPIGPEMTRGRGWYFIGDSVQVIEDRERKRKRRWMVAVFFSGRRFNRCYPVQFFRHLSVAKEVGCDYAWHLAGGGPVSRWANDSYLVGPDDRKRVAVLIVRDPPA